MGYIFKSLNMTKIKEIFKGKFRIIKDRLNYLHYDEGLLKKLQNGDFENIQFNLSDWFDKHYYGYLSATATGCGINGNIDMLYQVFSLVDKKMNNIDAAGLYSDRESVTSFLKKINPGFRLDSAVLTYSTDEELFVMANNIICDYAASILSCVVDSLFVLEVGNDKCNDMFLKLSHSKFPMIREKIKEKVLCQQEFASRWENYSEDAKYNILFLNSAIKNHFIKFTYYNKMNGEFGTLSFEGPLFLNNKTENLVLDLPRNIRNTKIVAEFLYQQIKNKNVLLADDVQFLGLVGDATYEGRKK